MVHISGLGRRTDYDAHRKITKATKDTKVCVNEAIAERGKKL